MATKLPIIIAKRYGKEYIRSKPEQVRQTPASITTATRFGKTSLLASQLVATFKPLIGYEVQQRIYHRLLSALVNWQHEQQCNPQSPQQNSKYFKGFRFVQKAGVEEKFRVKYTISYSTTTAEIQLPAFIPNKHIAAPKGCRSLELHWMAVSCKPASGEIRCVNDAVIPVQYNDAVHNAMQLQLNIDGDAGNLVLIGLAIRYNHIATGQKTKESELVWMPGGIVSSYYV